uniref:DH domain-containing protein n=1 Tax=Arcella intermedia TaxID=1963864 RepID=A0A6B2KZN1_9EUKA
MQSVKTIKNLLTIESAQECVKEAGGIPVLLQIAKAEKNEETKIAALSALFNFTIYSEDMRTSLLESGLDDLTRILTSSTQSDESKKLVAKSMVNMALSGENEKFSEKTTLTGLIKVLNHEDDEIDEYSSMTLENLAINKTLNEAISQYGGVEASIDFLKKASAKSNPKAKERSAKLISKLAISSKNRKKLQNPEVAKILKDLEKDVDPTVLSAIKLAQNNVNVPLFEAEEKAPVNFSEFDQYQLESEEEASEDESEIHEPEKVEKAPEQRATKEEHEKRRKRHTHKMPKKPPPPVDSDPERLRLARLDVKRTKVAYELLTTESSYCHNLEIIIRKFQNPLLQLSRSKKPLISINDIRAIFGSAEIIHGYNSMLLDSLQSRISKWGNQQIVGDIFLYMGDCFKIYTDYINNFPHAQQTLQNVTRDNPKFKKWLEKTCAQDFCSGLSLLSFLIMPVQRMPRYSLLLRELNSSTPAGHPDEGNIKEAIQKIEYVNSYLNDKKRETEGQFKMIELISNFVESDAPILLHNNRTVDQSWDVSWSDGKHKMNGQFVILSDSIIYSKVMQKKGKIMKLIEFAHISISDETKGEKLVLLIDEHDKKKTKFQLEVIFPKPIFASKAKSVIEAKFKEAKANK